MGENTPAWKKRSLRELNKLFEQKQFLDDLKRVRDGTLSEVALIKKYNLPIYSFTYVSHYIKTNKKDASKIAVPLTLVSEKLKEVTPSDLPKLEKILTSNNVIEDESLFLLIHSPITKQELLDYIDLNWKSNIEPFIERHFGSKAARIRKKPQLKRDEQIYRAYMKGKKPKDLQYEFDLPAPEISRIINRHKK